MEVKSSFGLDHPLGLMPLLLALPASAQCAACFRPYTPDMLGNGRTESL